MEQNNNPAPNLDLNEHKKQEEEIPLKIEVLNEQYKDYDLSFKIIVIGNSGVGKSCLALKATKNIFEEQFMSTVGFEFFVFNLKINEKNSKPTVDINCSSNIFFVAFNAKQLFPTPELPITIILKDKS